MTWLGRQPRQPQKTRGQVVHTEETPGYDDTITTGLIEKNILDEARASVAIDDGDDGTYAVEGGLPRTSVPSVASDPDERKEPTVSRKAKQPRGQATVDMNYAFAQIAVGQEFNAITVWNKMSKAAQTRWKSAYVNKHGALSHIRSVLNTEYHKGRNVTLSSVPNVQSTYTMLSHDPANPRKVKVPNTVPKKSRKGGRRVNTPTGGQAATVLHAIEGHMTNEHFKSADVWMWLSANTRAEWTDLYGGGTEARRKVSVAINNILNRTTDVPFERVNGLTGTYRARGTTTPKVVVDKPAVASPPQPKITTPVTDTLLARFTQIGTDMNGEPLFRDRRDGAIGHLFFTVLK